MSLTDNPSYQCPDYMAQHDDWQLVNDVYRGTKALQSSTRGAGTIGAGAGRLWATDGSYYLPKEPAESDKAYAVRLRRSVFWNAFRRTIQGLTGMVFRKNPTLGDDVPQQIQDLLEDIDLEGNHFDVFSKDLFKTALTDGHSFILVDMPQSPIEEADAQATLADEQEYGLRPYWCKIIKDQVVNWQTITEGGKTMLTQVTIREAVIDQVGVYEQKTAIQYRVLRPGGYEIYRKAQTGDDYVPVESGTTSLDFIPLVPCYTNRIGYMISDPPLLDFARENLRHYRLQSDLDHILHVANVPILCAIGRDTSGGKVDIGPNSLVDLPEKGDLKYVEHAGTAIDKAQAEIQNSKANMAALGLLLLAQKPQVQSTATESVLEYEAESSELAGMARGLEDALETALDYTAQFLGMGEDAGGTVKVNRDFAHIALDAQTITQIQTMVAQGQLTLETMWKMLEEAEILPEDFDADEEKAALEQSDQVQQRKLGLQRQQMAMEADRQAMTGNPYAIKQRLIDMAAGSSSPPS